MFSPLRIDDTSVSPEGSGDLLREKIWLGLVIRLGGSERRAGDPETNPGPDENFSLKLIMEVQCSIPFSA